jgi:hypothetical protein
MPPVVSIINSLFFIRQNRTEGKPYTARIQAVQEKMDQVKG